MRYTGTTANCSGEYCVLSGINADVLIGANYPASVDDLFAMSTNARRMSLDPVVVKYRPSDNEAIYRTEGSTSSANLLDRPIYNCRPAVSSSLSGDDTPRQKCIIIAWRNVLQTTSSTTPNSVRFSFSKVIEWTPQMASGISTAGRPTVKAASFDSIVSNLDRKVNGWDTPVPARSLVDYLTASTLGGSRPLTTKKFGIHFKIPDVGGVDVEL
jgi:hypothetical protein